MATMLSLFDGSGGFPLAGALCGITPKYASEVEPYPIAVTRSRFPNMIHLGDVSRIHGNEIDPVDVVTFGSPCQDMSIAGKRAGIKNENVGDAETTRSGLFHEAARIIREMREATNGVYPAFAVWENVPGAFSSNKGEDFRCVLETLIQIVEPGAVMPTVPKGGWSYFDHYCGDGWSLAYRTFDAQYWGVPQRRRRIYLVLDLRGQRAGEILFKREGLRGYSSPGGATGERTSSDAAGGAGVCDRPIPYTLKIRSGCEGGWKGPLIQEDMSATLATNNDQYLFVPVVYDGRGNGDGKTAGTITGDHERRPTDYSTVVCVATQQGGAEIAENLCPTITAAAGMSGNNQPVICMQGNTIDRNAQQNGFGINEDVSFTLNAVDRHGVAYAMAHGQANAEICKGCSPTLNCNHEQPIVFDKEVYNSGAAAAGGHYISQGGPAPSLRTEHPPGVCVRDVIRYIVRRLTEKECCRLQGFLDGWGEIDLLDEKDEKGVEFWKDVYKTYCAISGAKMQGSMLIGSGKIKRWHDKLHTASAEYKMWGNGIALPNAIYVMQGIEDAIKKRG